MSPLQIFLIFLFIRISSVFLVQTFFVPDEYWQSLEVAHRLTFGYGHLTWEWKHGIRSYIYPLLINTFYKVLQVTKLDHPEAIIYGPRILQALLSAYSDFCLYNWSGNKKWPVFNIATSWFWFYTGSRTLINTFECAVSTIALSKFPWPGLGIEDNSVFIWIIALLFEIRPTCAIMWAPLVLYHLAISKKSVLNVIIKRYVPIGLIVFSVSTMIDSICHGSLIVTPFRFFKLNVGKNVGSWYGEEPWHWYLSSGLPAVLGIQFLPFVLAALVIIKNRDSHPNELVLLGTVVLSVTVLSFLPHKEFRFVLPLLPVFLYISSRYMSAWSRKAQTYTIWLVAAIIFLGNAVPAWYLGMVHQRGTIDVMTDLREIAHKNPQNTSILFLMPCHSTPLYSHLHINVTTRFLTCLPNFDNVLGYTDEADNFYKSPSRWLRQNYPPDGTLPSHIVCFDNWIPILNDILSRYKQIKRIFHTNVPTSQRIGRYVVINERIDF